MPLGVAVLARRGTRAGARGSGRHRPGTRRWRSARAGRGTCGPWPAVGGGLPGSGRHADIGHGAAGPLLRRRARRAPVLVTVTAGRPALGPVAVPDRIPVAVRALGTPVRGRRPAAAIAPVTAGGRTARIRPGESRCRVRAVAGGAPVLALAAVGGARRPGIAGAGSRPWQGRVAAAGGRLSRLLVVAECPVVVGVSGPGPGRGLAVGQACRDTGCPGPRAGVPLQGRARGLRAPRRSLAGALWVAGAGLGRPWPPVTAAWPRIGRAGRAGRLAPAADLGSLPPVGIPVGGGQRLRPDALAAELAQPVVGVTALAIGRLAIVPPPAHHYLHDPVNHSEIRGELPAGAPGPRLRVPCPTRCRNHPKAANLARRPHSRYQRCHAAWKLRRPVLPRGQ